MIRVILFILLLTSLLGCSSQEVQPPQGATKSASPRDSGFKLHDFTTEDLDNGLHVIYVEEHSLPSISFGVLIKDGSASDPMAKSGLAELMSQVLVKGSLKMTASQIADNLGQLGSELNHDVSLDYTWFQVSGLSQHSSKLLEMFSEILLHPRFDQKELERARSVILASIKQKSDHPDQFTAEAFSAYLFGGHPYARPVSGREADLKSINRVDLFRAYKKFIKPNNAVLTVSGDITPELKQNIKAKFGDWKKQEVAQKSFPTPPTFTGINIRLIDKPDLTQSQIIMGNLGIKRDDPDFLKLRIANVSLGGNFSSRLMEQVRIKLGLTYGISSSFDAALDRGSFEISTFTKNKSVGETITESLKVFKKFVDGGVSAQEVEDAKNFLMGAFPRAIETPERLAYNLAILTLYGISDDYLKNFVINVSQITADEVNAAVKAHLDPNNLKIVVYSKAQDAAEQIRGLGLLEVKKFNDAF